MFFSIQLCLYIYTYKKTLFYIRFSIYIPAVKLFLRSFWAILAYQSIFPFFCIVFSAKIDYFSPSGISNSFNTSSNQFAYKYRFTNWAKKYKVIFNILLTLLIGKY